MNDEKISFVNQNIIIRKLKSSDSPDLINAGFPFGYEVLRSSLPTSILQAINIAPRETRLVAYHTSKKLAIGYLSLVEHSKLLYSIRYVFSSPTFRQKGVATGLINYALNFAEKKGGERVFLTSDTDPLSIASNLYRKLGFKTLSVNPVLIGNGNTSNFQLDKERNSLKLHRFLKIENKNEIFNIEKRSLSKDMINFFEINNTNFINGISQNYQHFFFKNVFIADLAKSFALVFNRPLMHEATAELYGQSPSFFPDMIIAINKVLYDRGIKYLKIYLFNAKDEISHTLLENRKFYPYKSMYMGRFL